MMNPTPSSYNIPKTPMMNQWQECKKNAKDALLFFRLGDFYEAFYEDAFIIAKELDLTLTKRQEIPMCGVPFHTSDAYVDKLVAKGYKVAIAEQKEDPKQAKGLVKRGVDRIVTPGTVINSSLIDDKSNNFFIALDQVGSTYGLAIIDLSTSEFKVVEIEKKKELSSELFRISPKEILVSEKFHEDHKIFFEELSHNFSFLLNTEKNYLFDHQVATDLITAYIHEKKIDSSFLQKGLIPAIKAAGALIAHLQDHLFLSLDHIEEIKTENLSGYMGLDNSCMRNLELFDSYSHEGKKHTLLHHLDQTETPMGGRLLQNWLKHPILDPIEIGYRQDRVALLLAHEEILFDLKSYLQDIKDLERLIMKISSGVASPKDLYSLRTSLEQVPKIKKLFEDLSSSVGKKMIDPLENVQEAVELIKKAISDEPPLRLSDGNIFKPEYSSTLDEWKQIAYSSKEWITNYQNELRVKTGIKTLKVGYTRVFGYYIEVSKGQSDKMPSSYQRRQTLVNAERFLSEELKEFESKILSAEERIKALEGKLYKELIEKISIHSPSIRKIAKGIAHIDSLFSLALVAKKHNYTRPLVDTSYKLHIENGRHPIIERSLEKGKFIPNDTIMDEKEKQLFLITGPNMAGKSTYIRQVALIVIMAQIGSFVPASNAHIGVVDRVFSRIGASDDLARGQSTFMVEMTETAFILQNATKRSLIILDEIGRGTSTYDGISIAYAVTEYLLTTKAKKAKTLFATHYWELTQLEGKIPGVINYNVAVKEVEDGIVFLHKIVKGGTDKSYGIHVAKLAGIPDMVIQRARTRLKQLEKLRATKSKSSISPLSEQLSLFSHISTQEVEEKERISPLEEEIKNMDLQNITPLEALSKLFQLQKKAQKTE